MEMITCFDVIELDELASTNAETRAEAVKRGSLTPAQFERALMDDYMIVRNAAVALGGLSDMQVERALLDDAWQVRKSVLNLNNMLSVSQIERSLIDEVAEVRLVSLSLCKLDSSQQERALLDESDTLRTAAVVRGGLSAAQLERALTDDSADVRMAAIGVGGLTFRQINREINRRRAGTPRFQTLELSSSMVREISAFNSKVKKYVFNRFGFTSECHALDYGLKSYSLSYNREYHGKIVYICHDEGYAIQSVGCGKAMIHDLSDFPQVPADGDVLIIEYKDSKVIGCKSGVPLIADIQNVIELNAL